MDKNEYNLKLEEMDKYVNQGNYTEAAKVADSIDWRRVRNIRTLCMVSEIYEADKRYEDSKAILTRAYHRSPVGRSILYRLVEVTIQLKQFDEALEYYTEYVQAAPNDTNKYILKYKIYRGRGSSLDEQIEILKEYLSQEYSEKWAYELARLYQQAGKIQECLAACDDLVLWFHSGKYVIKALELKQRYAPLTPKQQEIYEHRFDDPEPEEDIFDDAKLGQEKQIVETHEDVLADTIMADTEKEIAQAVAESRKEEEGLQEQDEQKDTEDGQEKEEEPETGDQVRKILMEQAAKEEEEKAAQDQVVKEAAEKAAQDQAEKEAAEKAAREQAAKEAAEKAVREQAAKEAAEKAVREQAVKEAAEKAAREQAAKEAAEKAAREQTVKEAEAQETGEETVEAAVKPAAKEQTVKAPASAEAVRNLQSEMVKSMREIVSGVGIRDTGLDEDAKNADRLINQSKNEQEADMPLSGQDAPSMNLPKRPENRQAAQLSIDDILLSMGEKGDAVRRAAAQSDAAKQARKAAPAGVVSAMDEALMNMGIRPDEEETQKVQAGQEPEQTPVQIEGKDETPSGQKIQDELPDTTPEEDIDIETAKTRRIPTKEIARLHAAYQADVKPEAAEDEEAEEAEETQARDIPKGGEEVSPQQPPRRPERQGRQMQEPVPQEKSVQERPKRKRPAGPRVDEAYRDLFEGFLEIQDLEAQIATAISVAGQKGNDRTSRTGNILIFGDHGCGKSTIAMGIAKAIAMEKGNQFVKLARIYATDLNRKDIAATIAKIAGGTLIIEEAGDLEDETVDQLTTAMEFRTDGLIVILEDEQRYIHELLMRHPRFTMKFTAQIFVPIYTIDELVNFGAIHAANQDYALSQEAAAMLYHRIEAVAAQGDAITITNVISLVDRAIHKSNKFFRKVFSGKKRYDENDCVILREKDFK